MIMHAEYQCSIIICNTSNGMSQGKVFFVIDGRTDGRMSFNGGGQKKTIHGQTDIVLSLPSSISSYRLSEK